ncbi:protein kinase [Schlesneria sp. T3-172]|uniref:protein kinase domain-containing protein n=1 Tax=Schlesneria sphaerica TaxID=3373610 RepID=UPI0037C71582
MSMPLNVDSFIAVLKKSGLVEIERVQKFLRETRSSTSHAETPAQVADRLVAGNLLTRWQADKLIQGKHRGYFLGKYKLLSLLGKGGMSSVYMAEHLLMRRRCAIKVLPAKRVDDSSYLERFYREAQAAASLDHPNIVRAYDVDHQDDGDRQIHFIVMEYVDGTSLQDLVPPQGLGSFLDAAEYARQAALGLQHAHENGMVHRDIKPGNLLVDRNGTLRILDLGLARFFRVDEGSEALTIRHDEKVLGTADYLAPEQAIDSHGVDARADLYSLGCTLYFMVTGQPPFNEGTLAQRLLAHQVKSPPALESLRPDLPPTLAAIIRKLMAKQPGNRFLNAAETELTLFRWVDDNADPEWRRRHASVYGSRAHDSNMNVRIPSAKTSPLAEQRPLSELVTPLPVLPTVVSTSRSTTEERTGRTSESGGGQESALADFLSSLDHSTISEVNSDKSMHKTSSRGLPTTSFKSSASSIQPARSATSTNSDPAPASFDAETPIAPVELHSSSANNPSQQNSRSATAARFGRRKFDSLLIVGSLLGISVLGVLFSYLGSNGGADVRKDSSPAKSLEFPKDKRVVRVGGKDADFQSIREALIAVRERYRPALGSSHRLVIKVSAGTYNERIHMDGRAGVWPEGIQIVGEGNVRLAPLGDEPVIRLSNLTRFTIEHVEVDADDKRVAIQLSDDLHECRLTDVTVGGFAEAGIDCVGVQGLGFGDGQLTFERLRFNPASSSAMGIRILKSNEQDVSNLVIRSCEFMRALDAAIVIQGGSPYRVSVCESIFYELNDGIRVDGAPVLRGIRIFNNTFRDINHAICFRDLPDERSSELSLRRNLFSKIRKSECQIERGFDEARFRSMLAISPPGIQDNWSDRPKPTMPEFGELPFLFENGGRQGEQMLTFSSVDPERSSFLAPAPNSPQKDVPGAQGDEKKWVGALGLD